MSSCPYSIGADDGLVQVEVWGVVPKEFEDEVYGEYEVTFAGKDFVINSYDMATSLDGVISTISMQCIMTTEELATFIKEMPQHTLPAMVIPNKYAEVTLTMYPEPDPLEFNNAIDSIEI